MDTSRRNILAGALSAGALAVIGAASVLSTTQPASAADRERRDERQYPKIHGALDALRSAREELAAAAGDDFHGHKAEALRAVDDAIKQLQALVEEHPH